MSDELNTSEVELFYGAPPDEKLNTKLERLAKSMDGEISKVEVTAEGTRLEFILADNTDATDFIELANIVISRFFPIQEISFEEHIEFKKFPDGVYFATGFKTKEFAQRAASFLRAAFSSYWIDELFDITLLQMNEAGEDNWVVCYGFPFETIIFEPYQDLNAEELREKFESLMENLEEELDDEEGKYFAEMIKKKRVLN